MDGISKMIEILKNKQPKEQLEMIFNNCKFYLNLVKKIGPFNRAFNKKIEKDEILKIKTRNRNSLFMINNTFDNFNNWLDKNGHVKRDLSVSFSTRSATLRNFGHVYYFFPIGKFNYTWVKTLDINMPDLKSNWRSDEVILFLNKQKNSKTENEFSSYFVTNKNIEKAHKNRYEVWCDCKKYYLISTKNRGMFSA